MRRLVSAVLGACLLSASTVPLVAGQNVVGAPAAIRDSPVSGGGTGTIRGRVTDNETGAPLRRAIVQLTAGREFYLVLTDAEGRYEFADVPATRYALTTRKSGYVSLDYGQRRPGEAGKTIDLAAEQTVSSVDFSVPRGAVIAVRVTDAFGGPLAQVSVYARQHRFIAGRRELAPPNGTGSTAQTNDNGEARLFGLMPGEYYVTALSVFALNPIAPADSGRSYVTTFHPGTASEAEATKVSLALGQETSITFPLVPSRLARVAGVVRTALGTPPPSSTMMLTYTIPGVSSGGRNVTMAPDGSFSLTGIVPGEYEISVNSDQRNAASAPEYARVPIVVSSQDITDLVVTTSAGGRLKGRIVFDTGSPPTGLRPASVALRTEFGQSTFGATGRTIVNPDWTFDSVGLFRDPVLRLGSTPVPTGWFLKSVTLNGKDVTDIPLEMSGNREISGLVVTLTQKQSEVAGDVVTDGGAPSRDYAAVVFSEDRSAWTPLSRAIATATPDQQGRFKIAGLPPGRYLAVALDYLPTGEERSTDLLSRLAGQATSFTLGEAEQKTLTLKVVQY